MLSWDGLKEIWMIKFRRTVVRLYVRRCHGRNLNGLGLSIKLTGRNGFGETVLITNSNFSRFGHNKLQGFVIPTIGPINAGAYSM